MLQFYITDAKAGCSVLGVVIYKNIQDGNRYLGKLVEGQPQTDLVCLGGRKVERKFQDLKNDLLVIW